MSYNEELQHNNDELRDILEDVKALPDGTGGVQPDYAQNDPAARDFIKNRPFYDSREWVAVHTEAETSPEGGTPSGQEYSTFAAASPNIFDLYPVGTTVKCVIDGVEYVSTIRESSRIGNYGIVSAGDNTGEPFCLFGLGTTIGVCVKGKPAGAYTVSVYALEGELKKIDSKFLPESVQGDYAQNDPAAPDYIKNRPFYDSEKWRIAHEVRQFLSFESGFDWIIGSDNIFDTVPVGTKCRIVVDGATYIGTMAAEPGATGTYSRYIGNGHLKNSDLPDTGDPFVFFPNGLDCATMIPCDTMPSAATISVLESGEIVRIDPKFLPDSMKPDWSQNDPAARDFIKNRPFYRDQKWKCVQEPQTIEISEENQFVTGEMGYCANSEHFLLSTYPEGTVFKLIVGGDEYVGTYKASGGYVGNGALYAPNSWGGYPDTGEDFLIVYYGSYGIGIVTRKPLTVCEVSVYMLESEELVVDPQYASLLSGGSLPYVIDSEAYTYGDDALAAILAGRQIYVKVPSQNPGGLYANFMPVLQYQLPQSGNDYLTLLYLKDGIAQNIMAALQTGSFDAVYGQIVMMLSQSYDDCPLKVSPIK